jgi:hypothetical protein
MASFSPITENHAEHHTACHSMQQLEQVGPLARKVLKSTQSCAASTPGRAALTLSAGSGGSDVPIWLQGAPRAMSLTSLGGDLWLLSDTTGAVFAFRAEVRRRSLSSAVGGGGGGDEVGSVPHSGLGGEADSASSAEQGRPQQTSPAQLGERRAPSGAGAVKGSAVGAPLPCPATANGLTPADVLVFAADTAGILPADGTGLLVWTRMGCPDAENHAGGRLAAPGLSPRVSIRIERAASPEHSKGHAMSG